MRACKHVLCIAGGKNVDEISSGVIHQFVKDVHEFETSRKAIPHPGYIEMAKHCMNCGVKLYTEANSEDLERVVKECGCWG